MADRLHTWVQGLCPDRFDAVYPYLARLMSLPLTDATSAGLAELDGQTLKQCTIQAAEIVLTCSASLQPLAMALEDLHWADPSSLELLEHLLPLTDRASLLLICVFRPHVDHGSWRIREIAARNYRHRHADLWLQPLSVADSEALVGNLLRVDALPQDLRGRILSRAEGNPFFVEEVIRTLIDRKAIELDTASGRWLATRDLAEAPVPETLQGVIAARIDHLHAETRHVLQLASVIGRIFLYRVLSEIAREERDLVGRVAGLAAPGPDPRARSHSRPGVHLQARADPGGGLRRHPQAPAQALPPPGGRGVGAPFPRPAGRAGRPAGAPLGAG